MIAFQLIRNRDFHLFSCIPEINPNLVSGELSNVIAAMIDL